METNTTGILSGRTRRLLLHEKALRAGRRGAPHEDRRSSSVEKVLLLRPQNRPNAPHAQHEQREDGPQLPSVQRKNGGDGGVHQRQKIRRGVLPLRGQVDVHAGHDQGEVGARFGVQWQQDVRHRREQRDEVSQELRGFRPGFRQVHLRKAHVAPGFGPRDFLVERQNFRMGQTGKSI